MINLSLARCIDNKGRSDLVIGKIYSIQEEPNHPSGKQVVQVFIQSKLHSYARASCFDKIEDKKKEEAPMTTTKRFVPYYVRCISDQSIWVSSDASLQVGKEYLVIEELGDGTECFVEGKIYWYPMAYFGEPIYQVAHLAKQFDFDVLLAALNKKFGRVFTHDSPAEGGWTIWCSSVPSNEKIVSDFVEAFLFGLAAAHP